MPQYKSKSGDKSFLKSSIISNKNSINRKSDTQSFEKEEEEEEYQYTIKDDEFVKEYAKKLNIPNKFLEDVWKLFELNINKEMVDDRKFREMVEEIKELPEKPTIDELSRKYLEIYSANHILLFVKKKYEKKGMNFGFSSLLWNAPETNFGFEKELLEHVNFKKLISPAKKWVEELSPRKFEFVVVNDTFFRQEFVLEILNIINTHFSSIEGWGFNNIEFKCEKDNPLFITVDNTKGDEYIFAIAPRVMDDEKETIQDLNKISIDMRDLVSLSMPWGSFELKAYDILKDLQNKDDLIRNKLNSKSLKTLSSLIKYSDTMMREMNGMIIDLIRMFIPKSSKKVVGEKTVEEYFQERLELLREKFDIIPAHDFTNLLHWDIKRAFKQLNYKQGVILNYVDSTISKQKDLESFISEKKTELQVQLLRNLHGDTKGLIKTLKKLEGFKDNEVLQGIVEGIERQIKDIEKHPIK